MITKNSGCLRARRSQNQSMYYRTIKPVPCAIAALTLLFSFCSIPESAFASETNSVDQPKTLRVDTGEYYGIYTLPFGLLIEPRWSPYVNIHYESANVVADLQSGIGYKILNHANFNAGVAAVYQYGRYESADSRYRGMGNVPASVAPSFFFEWVAFSGGMDVFVETGQTIGPAPSWYETIETTLAIPLSNSVNGFADILLTGGDARYTQSFYGVTPVQALRSGYDVYRPSGGLATAVSTAGLVYQCSSRWQVTAAIGMSQYVEAASNSPLLTQHRFSTGSVLLSYTF